MGQRGGPTSLEVTIFLYKSGAPLPRVYCFFVPETGDLSLESVRLADCNLFPSVPSVVGKPIPKEGRSGHPLTRLELPRYKEVPKIRNWAARRSYRLKQKWNCVKPFSSTNLRVFRVCVHLQKDQQVSEFSRTISG